MTPKTRQQRFFTSHQPKFPIFLLSPHLQWVRDNYELSRLYCPWIVRDDYRLCYLCQSTATLKIWKMFVRNYCKLLNSTLRSSALSFTLSAYKVLRETLLRCQASSFTTTSARSALSNNSPLRNFAQYHSTVKHLSLFSAKSIESREMRLIFIPRKFCNDSYALKVNIKQCCSENIESNRWSLPERASLFSSIPERQDRELCCTGWDLLFRQRARLYYTLLCNSAELRFSPIKPIFISTFGVPRHILLELAWMLSYESILKDILRYLALQKFCLV